jgi:hypothetical protein
LNRPEGDVLPPLVPIHATSAWLNKYPVLREVVEKRTVLINVWLFLVPIAGLDFPPQAWPAEVVMSRVLLQLPW